MNKTILVVDDSATVVKFVSFSLINKGYNVLTACDGMDALEKLSHEDGQVDLIITDLNMPNLDGYGLIATLRENDLHRETPIIILSSEEDEQDKELGTRAGATSYLVKPFKPNVLIDEVRKYID